MSKGEYEKISQLPELESKCISVPPYAPEPPSYTRSEACHDVNLDTVDAPSYCLMSWFSFCCCFSPAGLIGLYFGHKTNQANSSGDKQSAQYYSRLAKKSMRWSVFIGVFFTLLALFGHLSMMGSVLHSAKHEFKFGYHAGMKQGSVLGRSQASSDLITSVNGAINGLPDALPSLPGNVFDVNDPFYHLGSLDLMARYLGEHFGYTDGFRVGYCKTEGVTCTAEEKHTLRWYRHRGKGCHGPRKGEHRGPHGDHMKHHEDHTDVQEQVHQHVKEVQKNLGVEGKARFGMKKHVKQHLKEVKNNLGMKGNMKDLIDEQIEDMKE
eukprot:CFRG4396T1